MDKKERLERLIEILTMGNTLSSMEIAEVLETSVGSVNRDIRDIKNMGFEVRCTKGRYGILGIPEKLLVDEAITTIDLRIMKVVQEIAGGKNEFVEESSLIKKLERLDDYDSEKELLMCKKTLKKNLRALCEQEIIERVTQNHKGRLAIGYRIKGKRKLKELSLEDSVKLIRLIRGNINPLPNNKLLISVADKLETLVAHEICNAGENVADNVSVEISTSYKLISNEIDNDISEKENIWIDMLTKACSDYRLLEIQLKNKTKVIRHFPLFVAFQATYNRWYLIVKKSGKERKYGMIRIDRIEKIQEIEGIKADPNMKDRIEEVKEIAWREISTSFGMGLSDSIKMKLHILSNLEIQEEFFTRITLYKLIESKMHSDGSITIEVEIGSVSDFMHWLRGFGSKVEILEPSYLHQEQLHEFRKMKEKYMEVQYATQL